MSNPRKFSEKIQIQLQKQEEETRVFNQMMEEAQFVKHLCNSQNSLPQVHNQHHVQNFGHHQISQPHQVHGQHMSRQHLGAPNFPQYRGGSLPNVHGLVHHQTNAGIDLQNALESLEALRDPSSRSVRHASPSPPGTQRRQFPNNKRPVESYDTSHLPHSYLSPPESSHLTKRAHSDSALHQSANPQLLDISHQPLMGTFTPTRRSPVPDKPLDQNFLMWNEHNKMMQSRPKSCEIAGMSGGDYTTNSTHQQHQRQQQQHHQQQQVSMHPQHQQHSQQQQLNHLSPSSIHAPPALTQSTGSLPDLTNPSLNPSFQPLVPPLDSEDVQNFSQNQNSQMRSNSNHQIRAPGSHSPSVSPQGHRRQMRGSQDSINTHSAQRKPSPHSSHTSSSFVPDQRNNHPGKYNPYGGNQLGQQNFGAYRSNSSSPGIQDQQLGVMNVPSNPSSPGTTPVGSYIQDPLYQDMQQTVQHKFEQITMEQQQQGMSSNINMNDPYNFFAYLNNDGTQRNHLGADMGQIPDIVFTESAIEYYTAGADDPSNLRGDFNFLQSSNSSGGNQQMYSNHNHNPNDPFSSGQLNQEHVDILEQVFKLDQYDLGMLSDENLRNMVDPEAEEQFHLESNIH